MGLEVRGVDELKAKLEAVAARARDLTPVLTVAAQDTKTLIDDSFAGSTTPENIPWAPLAESTVARRRQAAACLWWTRRTYGTASRHMGEERR
jgi:hypothetical protein